MERKEKIRISIGLTMNIIVFLCMIFCLFFLIKHTIDNPDDNRFRYFTNISNIAVGCVALVNIVFLIVSLIKGRIIFPQCVSIIKFVALSMTNLTFLTVLFLLAPMTSFVQMYREIKFFTHLIIPVFAMISYLFFEEKTLFKWKFIFFGLVPFTLYSTIYITNVVFLKRWPDLYQINKDGLWFLYLTLFCIVDFGICVGMYFLKRLTKKEPKQESS